MKIYQLPSELSRWIGQHQANSPTPQVSSSLVQGILKVSDNYQNQSSVTPWADPQTFAAYLSYFFPLNYIRALKVIDEASTWNFFNNVDQVIDLGCGPGTLTRALIDNKRIQIPSYIGIDSHHGLSSVFESHSHKNSEVRFQKLMPRLHKKTKSLLIASYVLNELKTTPALF